MEMYTYRWDQWLMIFFCYSFFGWIFESAYVSLRKHHFVDRGFLRLPMLPLYGTGAVMMLFVSLPVKDNLVAVYFAGVIAATALEYVTGWGMEKLFKMRYWDYSDQRFQIKGYICLSSSIAWGFLSILLTEVLHQPVERLVLGMDETLERLLVTVIGTVFGADVVASTRAALELGQTLEAVTRMKGELEELQVQLALLKSELKQQADRQIAFAHGEAALRIAELKEEAASRMNGAKSSGVVRMAEETAALAAGLKEEAVRKLEELRADAKERFEDLQDNLTEHVEALQESTAAHLEELKERADGRLEKLKTKMDGERGQTLTDGTLALADKLAVLADRAEELRVHSKARMEGRAGIGRFYRNGLLKGNPTARSAAHQAALQELRESLGQRNAQCAGQERGMDEDARRKSEGGGDPGKEREG